MPLDRSDPETPLVSLAVRRIRATDPAERLGVLVAIAGGPGQRGTDLIDPARYARSITSRFDVVGLDPRGTSGETSITCIPVWDPYDSLDRTPDDPAERRALDDRIRQLAEGCSEEHGNVLPHIGTSDTVLDLESLRQALGEVRLSLLGFSYGTEVALRYATAFPERTRAVVLDGYSDPNLDPGERELEQAAAFERQLDELLAECALRDDCPIDGAVAPGAALDRLLNELDGAPVPTGEDRALRQSDAYEAIMGALVGGRADREGLLFAIAAAVAGDGRRLLELADEIRRSFEASGLDLGTFAAISCADDGAAWAGLDDDEIAALTREVLDAAPRLGAWLWSPPDADDLPPIGLCAMSPGQSAAVAGPFDGAGAGPILVLAASGDPATPLSAAVRAVDDLEDAALLAIREDQHLVYPYALAAPDSPTNRCVLDVVEAYLVGGATPASDTCP